MIGEAGSEAPAENQDGKEGVGGWSKEEKI